jgi:hypothetical protein
LQRVQIKKERDECDGHDSLLYEDFEQKNFR